MVKAVKTASKKKSVAGAPVPPVPPTFAPVVSAFAGDHTVSRRLRRGSRSPKRRTGSCGGGSGHIVVDETTDLPEGTELTLVMVDADDDTTAEERADLARRSAASL
jgi:hypothetical protein